MTAVFCDDDVLAAGLFVAARELGVRIPDDLAVVGFGDFDIGRVLDPALTTIVADAAELGKMAFDVLSEQMAGGTPADRVLPVSLAVRGSTAAGVTSLDRGNTRRRISVTYDMSALYAFHHT